MPNDNLRVPKITSSGPFNYEWELRSKYLIPIFVRCDSGVSSEEYRAAIEGIMTIVKLSEHSRKVVSFGKASQDGYLSCDWYVNNAIHRGNQIDAISIYSKIITEPWQKYPNTHLDVVIVSKDLFAHDLDWVFGIGFQNYASIQSIYRFRNETDQVKLDLINRTLKHEVGHLLGIPGPVGSHPRIYEKGGEHCSNVCLMRQGWSLEEFKTQMIEEKKRGIELCPDCLRELKIKQTRLPMIY